MSGKVTSIEYIRGVAMLGVVGIHTGAYSLANPNVNIHLFALLEIFTRFSVPIFFFVTAFGLFIKTDLNRPFDYVRYCKRRCRTVLVPYLAWSAFYMLHYSMTSGDYQLWSLSNVVQYLLFGLASYQLYFLVILVWFYAFMPLWRALLKIILTRPLHYLSLLLVLQIAFNYYSCYMVTAQPGSNYLKLFIQYRVSYLPLHYLFIFMLGAVAAQRYQEFIRFITGRQKAIFAFGLLSLAGMLGAYYWLLGFADFSPVAAVNTIHQLSPIGVIYTFAAALFLMVLFTYHVPAGGTSSVLEGLSRYSYPVYLAHPLIMYYLVSYLEVMQVTLTAPVIIVLYLTTIAASLLFATILERTSSHVPYFGLLFNGGGSVSKKINLAG